MLLTLFINKLQDKYFNRQDKWNKEELQFVMRFFLVLLKYRVKRDIQYTTWRTLLQYIWQPGDHWWQPNKTIRPDIPWPQSHRVTWEPKKHGIFHRGKPFRLPILMSWYLSLIGSAGSVGNTNDLPSSSSRQLDLSLLLFFFNWRMSVLVNWNFPLQLKKYELKY